MKFSGVSFKVGKSRVYFRSGGSKSRKSSGRRWNWRVIFGVIFAVGFIGMLGDADTKVGTKIFAFVGAVVLLGWNYLYLIPAGIAALVGKLNKQKSKPVGEPELPQVKVSVASETTDWYEIAQRCQYCYHNVGLYRPDDVEPMPEVGDEVTFIEEPDNPYDSLAIYAEVNGQNVGYLNKGKLRAFIADMLHSSTAVIRAGVTKADERLEISVGIDK